MAKKRGAKLKLMSQPELMDKVFELARMGHFKNMICIGLGIEINTFFNWERKAKAAIEKKEEDRTVEDILYIQFMEQYHGGRQACQNDQLKKIGEAQDWKAASWMLERMDKQWQKKTPVDLEDLYIRIKKDYDEQTAEEVTDVLERADRRLEEE